MKTYKDLFEQVGSFRNLLAAYRKARRGKRNQRAVAEFEFDLESKLLNLLGELAEGTYQPGGYRSFYIHEPKKRLISAAPFRDRVVHHAVCNVVEPLFERSFIYDSYAKSGATIRVSARGRDVLADAGGRFGPYGTPVLRKSRILGLEGGVPAGRWGRGATARRPTGKGRSVRGRPDHTSQRDAEGGSAVARLSTSSFRLPGTPAKPACTVVVSVAGACRVPARVRRRFCPGRVVRRRGGMGACGRVRRPVWAPMSPSVRTAAPQHRPNRPIVW